MRNRSDFTPKPSLQPATNPWTTLSSKKIYENPWIIVQEDQVLNPAGNRGIYGKLLFRDKAVGVIPIDHQSNIWLVGQYRYVLDAYSWEIPEGGASTGQTPLEAAQRELKEETGLTANTWTLLMQLHTSNCVTNEEAFVFVAQDLTEGEPEPEETEDIAVKKVLFTEAIRMVMDGEITDSISVASLLKLSRLALAYGIRT